MRFVLLATLFTACTSDTPDDTDPSGTDADATCDVVDCANTACASEPACGFGDGISQDSALVFTGREIECALGPVTVPYDVPDCATRFTVAMTQRTEGDVCPSCDATYEGTIVYSEDTCSELIGTDAPTSGVWGFIALSATERELWVQEAGVWVASEVLTLTDGRYTASITEAVRQDPPDCNNGEQYVGDITVEVAFTDAE